MDLPGHSDLYIGKAGRDFCQQWHFHMWGQSHPGIGDGDGWCGDCVDVDTQAFDTQLIHSWYTVDTQAVDWYVAPLLNPDGYEYSHTNDRLWRKNRSLKRILTAFYNLNYIFHNMWIEIYSLYRIAEHFPQGASTIKVPLPLSPFSPMLLWSWPKQVDRETETFMFMSSFTGHG